MLRPQTWYLLLAAICMIVCAIAGTGTVVQLVALLVAAVASLAVIPLYKNRKLQATLCLLPMVLLLAWYVVLGLNAIPETLHWYHALPAVAIILVFMARKGVLRDEKLVRSLDRIR